MNRTHLMFRAPTTIQYNCRYSNCSLKYLAPGETRAERFCEDCEHKPYQSPTCLFRSPKREKPHSLTYHWQSANRKHHRPHRNRLTEQDMVDAIKKRWVKLGTPPLIKDLGSKYGTISSNTISSQFPGGLPAARRRAAEQLGRKIEFKCSRCDKSFTTPQGRNAHKSHCTEPKTEF